MGSCRVSLVPGFLSSLCSPFVRLQPSAELPPRGGLRLTPLLLSLPSLGPMASSFLLALVLP
eukprot:2356592-Heterocapsa_arctica.AAC.1